MSEEWMVCTEKFQPFLGWNHPDLWNIRRDALEVERWSDDQHCAVLPIPDSCSFFVVSYYKHRGRTEGLFVVSGDSVRTATQEDVDAYNAARASRESTDGL